MIVLRPARESDFTTIATMALESLIGVTTLPKDPILLERRLLHSCESFSAHPLRAGNELYLFVAEDLKHHEVIGISGIEATTGQDGPLYFFKRERYDTDSILEKVPKSIPILTPVSYLHGSSEVCSLFVTPRWRRCGVGTLLSIARFLFVAAHKHLFTASIYTELRGVIEDGRSPFWEGIGSKFFSATFEEAHDLFKYGKTFITEFLPKYPIYIDLLPQEVQNVIGKTHEETAKAQKILISQGFQTTALIDIFDGGPKLEVLQENVDAIRSSRLMPVEEIIKEIEPKVEALVSNERFDFRCCSSPIIVGKHGITIDKATAEALEISLSDNVRIYIEGKHALD